jgi:acyl carrier protein
MTSPTYSRCSRRNKKNGRGGGGLPFLIHKMRFCVMTFEKLRNIISELLDVDADEITLESGLEDLDIDSLDVVDIIMSAEDEFGIEIPDEAAKGFKSVGDFVNYIDSQK